MEYSGGGYFRKEGQGKQQIIHAPEVMEDFKDLLNSFEVDHPKITQKLAKKYKEKYGINK